MKVNANYTKRQTSKGFTIVEVLVTVSILSLFIFGFFQTYLVLESQRVSVARQARASDIAYSNLRKVPSRPTGLTQAVCTANSSVMDLTTGNPSTKPGLNLTTYGYYLEPTSEIQPYLGSNATQTLVAYAPVGCANFDANPVKIVSTVTFGLNGDRVSHASYVK